MCSMISLLPNLLQILDIVCNKQRGEFNLILKNRKLLSYIVGGIAGVAVIILVIMLIMSSTKIEQLELQLHGNSNHLTSVNDKYNDCVTEVSQLNNQLEEERNSVAALENKVAELESQVTILTDEVEVEQGKNIIWEGRVEEFPVATEAWMYMKSVFGWSDAVCAGILGNFMSETGGQTLALDWDSNSASGYGLAQWLGSREDQLKGKYGEYPTVAEQLEFMYDELYGTDGVTQQVTDWQRDRILNASTPREAAAEFARWFERPASTKYGVRQSNAERALDYFT